MRRSHRRRSQVFLQLILYRSKKRQTALRLPAILCLRIATTTSSSVKAGCSAIRASSHSACSPNGGVLPPLGFAAKLPVSSRRCLHSTAALALVS